MTRRRDILRSAAWAAALALPLAVDAALVHGWGIYLFYLRVPAVRWASGALALAALLALAVRLARPARRGGARDRP